jgi:hypothetical protein
VNRLFNFLLALILIPFTIEQAFAPTSWWIEVRKVFVPDFQAGDPLPPVAVDDTINRTFVGHYFIDIRKVNSFSSAAAVDLTRFSYFCSGDGALSFRPGSTSVSNVDLTWWTRSRCPKIGEGAYYAHIILEWRDFLVTRSITLDSNVWTVSAPPPPQAAPKVITKTVVRTVKRAVRGKCVPSLVPYRSCERGRPVRGRASGR